MRVKVKVIKDTHREKAPSNKTPALTESTDLSIGSLVHQINSLQDVLQRKQNFQKIKVLTGKYSSFSKKAFVS